MPTMDARVLTDEADGLDALSAALGLRRTGSRRPAATRPMPLPQPPLVSAVAPRFYVVV